jgi:transcription elongation factor S-II
MEVQVVFLGQKGEIRQGKLKNMNADGFMSAFKKKEAPSLLGKCSWKQKQRILYFFGYPLGKAGTENQHHLPSPLEGITCFGDIMVTSSSSPSSYTPPIGLKTAEYETFYSSNLEGDDSDAEASEGEGVADAEDLEDDVNGDVGVEEDDAVSVEGEGDADGDGDGDADAEGDGDAEGEIELIKPVRATRVRKSAVVAQEEPEVESLASYESSPHRIRVYELAKNLFGSKVSPEEAVKLEAIVYKKAFEAADAEDIRKSWNLQAFRDIYFAIARRLIGNLNPNSYIGNKNLWERYITNELTLEEIAKQNYYELCPENWQQMVDRQAKKEQIQLEGDFSRATDKWACHGCKQRKCTYYELQTRSSDEPMTIFIHCLNCGKRWTQ